MHPRSSRLRPPSGPGRSENRAQVRTGSDLPPGLEPTRRSPARPASRPDRSSASTAACAPVSGPMRGSPGLLDRSRLAGSASMRGRGPAGGRWGSRPPPSRVGGRYPARFEGAWVLFPSETRRRRGSASRSASRERRTTPAPRWRAVRRTAARSCEASEVAGLRPRRSCRNATNERGRSSCDESSSTSPRFPRRATRALPTSSASDRLAADPSR